ncbi:MAG: hypothetical protein KIT73_14865 [Burkholderiales bacterium]|nr:hypothetical protein [Burkholderiales bacterium]
MAPSARPATPPSRPETVLATTLYLMTAYLRNPCPSVAAVVHRHLECLATHPTADPVLRNLAGDIGADWARISTVGSGPARRTTYGPPHHAVATRHPISMLVPA